MDSETFYSYVKHLRESKGLPLRKVAARLDIDPSTLSKIERGERGANLELVNLFSEIFGVSEKDLKKMFLSDKIVEQLWNENNSDEILEAAKEKIKYLKSIRVQQGQIGFANA